MTTAQPVPNAARNTWVTETALTTALNMSYMAEQLALFGIVVGIALLLAGIGFVLLAFLAVRRWAEGTETSKVTTKVAPARSAIPLHPLRRAPPRGALRRPGTLTP